MDKTLDLIKECGDSFRSLKYTPKDKKTPWRATARGEVLEIDGKKMSQKDEHGYGKTSEEAMQNLLLKI